MDSHPSVVVYLASFAALLGALSMGLALGYTAPAFANMEAQQPSILDPDPSKRESQKSLIGSMLPIGALFGGILAEPGNKILGRRLSLIIYGVPFGLGWLLIATANGIPMLIMGRLLIGLCCGLVSGTAPTYVCEIATANIRGLLGTSFQIMVVIGILMASVFGTFMSWQALAGVSIFASLGMSALMLCMPETPQWLLSKSRSEDAELSLKHLRTSAINAEFSVMTETAANIAQGGSQYSCEVMSSREFIKPLVLSVSLMFFQQASGINAVLFYQTDIFKKAAPAMDATLLTIYVNLAQVVATGVGSVLVDRLGRRILLMMSGFGHTGSLLIFGFYSYASAKSPEFQAGYAWISLLSLIVFMSSFSIGFGPIPWMMVPELSSSRVRSMVAAISTATNWFMAFVVTAFVKNMIESIGDAWTYWCFSIICALSCIFVIYALPETKGRTSEQIQRELLNLQ